MYEYNLGLRFERIVERYSSNVALRFSRANSVSYEELNLKANQLARHLLDLAVGQHDVICISGTKDLTVFACMIACLKIGAVYSLLDPQSPVERLRKMMASCNPKVLFVESQLRDTLQEICKDINGTIVDYQEDALTRRLNQFDHTNLVETRKVDGTNPAYIMFTSGSTGFPKGAVMLHANVLNLIEWAVDTYHILPDDILTNVNPLYFDNSVFDFYCSLFCGASLVPLSRETVTNPKLLVEMIDESRCTSWFSVPSLLIFLDTMKALNKQNMKYIKRLIFGGEGYPKAQLKRLYDTYCDRVELFNVYGPTECTCICSSYKISADDFRDLRGFPPLGELADNFSYLILDDDNHKVQDGQIGQLCLLGPNVGPGYYNDPERTRKSFVQNPYNDHYIDIMYKTGDVVKREPEDRQIYIMGRVDNQIKHMGYRIELEEIETALSCLSYISEAAVLHGMASGLSEIVAVVSAERGVQEGAIREDLKAIIPAYMLPRRVCFERELPKNSNGKVDRVKLAEAHLRHD